MSKLSRRLARLWHLPAADKRHFVSVFVTIVFVRLALSGFGYARLSKLIPPATDTAPIDTLRKLGRRVPRLARLVPGASCLTQAVAGQILLARDGYRSDMRVGVREDETGRITAHAWLLSDGKIILGGQPAELQTYAPLVDLSPRSS